MDEIEVKFVVTCRIVGGEIDRNYLRASIRDAIQHAKADSGITSDDDAGYVDSFIVDHLV